MYSSADADNVEYINIYKTVSKVSAYYALPQPPTPPSEHVTRWKSYNLNTRNKKGHQLLQPHKQNQEVNNICFAVQFIKLIEVCREETRGR